MLLLLKTNFIITLFLFLCNSLLPIHVLQFHPRRSVKSNHVAINYIKVREKQILL